MYSKLFHAKIPKTCNKKEKYMKITRIHQACGQQTFVICIYIIYFRWQVQYFAPNKCHSHLKNYFAHACVISKTFAQISSFQQITVRNSNFLRCSSLLKAKFTRINIIIRPIKTTYSPVKILFTTVLSKLFTIAQFQVKLS